MFSKTITASTAIMALSSLAAAAPAELSLTAQLQLADT